MMLLTKNCIQFVVFRSHPRSCGKCSSRSFLFFQFIFPSFLCIECFFRSFLKHRRAAVTLRGKIKTMQLATSATHEGISMWQMALALPSACSTFALYLWNGSWTTWQCCEYHIRKYNRDESHRNSRLHSEPYSRSSSQGMFYRLQILLYRYTHRCHAARCLTRYNPGCRESLCRHRRMISPPSNFRQIFWKKSHLLHLLTVTHQTASLSNNFNSIKMV